MGTLAAGLLGVAAFGALTYERRAGRLATIGIGGGG
jgi:hypothetical protein